MSSAFDDLLPEQLWLLEYFMRKGDWQVIDGPRTAQLYSIGLLDRQDLPPFKTHRINEKGADVVTRFRRRLASQRIDLDEAYAEAKVTAALPMNA